MRAEQAALPQNEVNSLSCDAVAPEAVLNTAVMGADDVAFHGKEPFTCHDTIS